ncbi:MAG: hypothetical protein FRX48_03992 [Lasallia pustulata]|uniref:Protein BIG1 n=1 Tax=Lasallia pustulata TaxID=136370 RepID=A0A5M8PS83_9LECA|nr:MAG: hypothetical protein FRX48_03992 [Lasallia pustulata]
MYFNTLGALALSIAAVDAFKDTSPLFFFSSSEILIPSSQVASAASITAELESQLEKCPSDTYIVVSQPGVKAADYDNRFSAPHLRKRIGGDDENARSSFTVADVFGEIDPNGLVRLVEKKCGAGLMSVDASTGSFAKIDDMRPRVIQLYFPPLPTSSDRATTLAENDAFLASVLDLLPSPKYTVIYTTSPLSTTHHSVIEEFQVYEMDSTFAAPLHMDLKRDFSVRASNSSGNDTLVDGPLFERYQFLTPGIFMTFLVGFLLLAILYTAIGGVASLQVTYAAFDKENGPAAQRKQQEQ